MVEVVKERNEIWNTTALCVGLGEACRIYLNEMKTENEKIKKLGNIF